MTSTHPDLSPIDYLVVGHIAQDLNSDGQRHLGGTVSFAAGMARALGCRVGIVTAAGPEADLSALHSIQIVCHPSPISTTFENRYIAAGRVQYLHHRAVTLDASSIPAAWLCTPIAHLGPLVREVDPGLIGNLQGSFVGVTPQGWLRQWNAQGLVSRTEWAAAPEVLPRVDAAVLSIEDVEGDWDIVEQWATYTRILVVTQAEQGATIFVGTQRHHLPAPQAPVVDPTGAGDLFAAAFFIHLQQTNDYLAAGRFAIALASASVTRSGLASWPTKKEIETALSK